MQENRINGQDNLVTL